MHLKYSAIKKGTSREQITVNAHLFSLFGASLFGCCSYTSSLRIMQKLAKALGSTMPEGITFLVVNLLTNILTTTKKKKALINPL